MIKKRTLLKSWGLAALMLGTSVLSYASSHREAPLIANDPQADNTDVYAFRSPDDPNTITIIANYIPFELPEGGPNYYTFGTDVRYEIHVKNNTATTTDDITYRFAFTQVNEDPATHFNIRLGQRNLRLRYTVTKLINGATTGTVIVNNAQVPPNNIGPRSIEQPIGLNQPSYSSLVATSIATGTNGEQVYAGPADDPFFADLGGIFDLGNVRPNGNLINPTKDGLARYNVNSICLKIPISQLQKSGKTVQMATSILDQEFVIGVWASASRRSIKTLNGNGTVSYNNSPYIQVSRLGMPLTNEAIIPVGKKDLWNSMTPTDSANVQFVPNFTNPELALYMDDRLYGKAVPALNALRIQTASRRDILAAGFDFGNTHKGLWPLHGSTQLGGTALDPNNFGNMLLPDSMSPRAIDILPIFLTGVPNLAPYQLATGKTGGNPLAPGKPFLGNFLASRTVVGDMLRLNMAVPVTPRNSPAFSSLGIIGAAVLGLTDTTYNKTNDLQAIPNMDGFPNGRRLEDDVTTIELQVVGGAALAAIGLWYNDYNGTGSPVTAALGRTLSFTAGPVKNDTTFKTVFPYVQEPWRGYDYSKQARF